MSRRLKADAGPSVALAVVDQLGDQLAVWAIQTYGDGTPSAAYQKLAHKKLGGGKKAEADEAAAAGSPWSFLGIFGAGTAGAGIGVVGIGAAMMVLGPVDAPSPTEGTLESKDQIVPMIVTGTGAAIFLGGAALMVYDGLE